MTLRHSFNHYYSSGVVESNVIAFSRDLLILAFFILGELSVFISVGDFF
jgi:hypothetical protein